MRQSPRYFHTIRIFRPGWRDVRKNPDHEGKIFENVLVVICEFHKKRAIPRMRISKISSGRELEVSGKKRLCLSPRSRAPARFICGHPYPYGKGESPYRLTGRTILYDSDQKAPAADKKNPYR